jgi:hypothetical protein
MRRKSGKNPPTNEPRNRIDAPAASSATRIIVMGIIPTSPKMLSTKAANPASTCPPAAARLIECISRRTTWFSVLNELNQIDSPPVNNSDRGLDFSVVLPSGDQADRFRSGGLRRVAPELPHHDSERPRASRTGLCRAERRRELRTGRHKDSDKNRYL